MSRRRRSARSGWAGEEARRERTRRSELSATRERSGWCGRRPAVVSSACTGRAGAGAVGEAADGRRRREERRDWQKAKVCLGMYARRAAGMTVCLASSPPAHFHSRST
ncbi:hypothetical protein DAI22_03g046032 [Oryza sativa Japonica Group]|nr:hypothetical protein DAI22_03g046032 [Oryza sativa Japonica Group]